MLPNEQIRARIRGDASRTMDTPSRMRRSSAIKSCSGLSAGVASTAAASAAGSPSSAGKRRQQRGGGGAAADTGSLTVKVIEATDLKQMDSVGKNDAYCSVTVGGKTLRTSTIDGKSYGKGRKDPRWNEGAGEELRFEVAEVPSQINVAAFDEDVGSDDDLIGAGTVEIGEADRAKLTAAQVSGGAGFAMDVWCEIAGKGGKGTGRVHVVIVQMQ